jgi:orotate phosphoribosyltransferase
MSGPASGRGEAAGRGETAVHSVGQDMRAATRTKPEDPVAQAFVRFAVDAGVLSFGEFKTKAGRLSPYFFNAGLFNDGLLLGRLAGFYAQRLAASGLAVDLLFGPAYKGITLVSALAVELARLGSNRPFAYNRKETKDHGEGGVLVGAPVKGRVLIVDDVISAGTSVNESVALIRGAGASPAGVLIALDRQERSAQGGVESPLSAVQQVQASHGLPVLAVACLEDLLNFLASSGSPALAAHLPRVQAYRDRYGVAAE